MTIDSEDIKALAEIAARSNEPLHPDLVPYYDDGTSEDGTRFPMVRHPLVYDLLPIMGQTNRTYLSKKAALAKAIEDEDWHQVIFLHERPYRLKALVDYVTGTDDGETPLPIDPTDHDALNLAADVWVDSENIEQVMEDWRHLLGDLPWWAFIGTEQEKREFEALPWGLETPADTVMAYRGGTVGDWSWTTNLYTAGTFAKRSGYEPRYSVIHRSECFGYFTRRGESELLVRLTDERRPLVYPNEVE